MQPQNQSPNHNQPNQTEASSTQPVNTAEPQVPIITMDNLQPQRPGMTMPVKDEVSWVAKEYISAEKTWVWYVGLVVVVALGIALDFFVLKSWTVSVLAVVIAIVLVVMSVRPPRDINYKLSADGLNVGEAIYRLEDYKAFGVMHDGKENTIYLMPIKRFKPGLSVYFPVDSGDEIVGFLSSKLPMQEVKLDFIDKIVGIFKL